MFVCFRLIVTFVFACVNSNSVECFFNGILFRQNDDEAERRASRARVSLASDSSVIQHKEGLDNCLKIFNDNVSEKAAMFVRPENLMDENKFNF